MAYENTTTTENIVATPVAVKRKVLKADPDLVVVTPVEDRKMIYARRWYELKRGEQIAVPKAMKEDLARCRVILEV